MSNIIVIRQKSETLNGQVNYEKLNVVLRLSSFGIYQNCFDYNGEIFIRFDQELSEAQKTLLNQIIASHDGSVPATSKGMIENRIEKFNMIVQMSIYHPALDENDVTGYLTHIDNYKNAFLTDGNDYHIVSKIAQDSQNTSHEYYPFLQTIVNPAGNKAYEYLIGQIQLI